MGTYRETLKNQAYSVELVQINDTDEAEVNFHGVAGGVLIKNTVCPQILKNSFRTVYLQ